MANPLIKIRNTQPYRIDWDQHAKEIPAITKQLAKVCQDIDYSFQIIFESLKNVVAQINLLAASGGSGGSSSGGGSTGTGSVKTVIQGLPYGLDGNDGDDAFSGTNTFGVNTLPATSSGITSPEVPIVVTTNTLIDTNFGEVIPESLEIAGGVQLEVAGGARLEITGQSGTATNTSVFSTQGGVQSLALTARKNTGEMYCFKTAASSAFTVIGFTAVPSVADGGARGFITDNRGNWRGLQTTAAVGNVANITDTTDFVWLNHEPRLLIHMRFGSSVTGMRMWIGFWNNNSVDTDFNTRTGAGVRYSPGAGDTGFVPQSSDGTSQTLGNSVGTIAANEEYLLSIKLTDFGSSMNVDVERLSDGSVSSGRIAVLSGALSQSLFCYQMRNSSVDGTAKFFDVERISLEFGFLMPAI